MDLTEPITHERLSAALLAAPLTVPHAALHVALPTVRTTCRVYVADAQTLFRIGLATLLADCPGVVLAGQARCVNDLLSDAWAHAPDLLFVDVMLPGLHSPAAWGELRRRHPQLRCVLLMAEDDPVQARRARELRADGVLWRSADRAQLEALIAAACRGDKLPAPPRLGGGDALPRLTRREQQMLQCMAQGLSNARMASQMNVATPTVKFHVTNILGKLGAENRTAAVLIAMRLGLVPQVDAADSLAA